MTKKTLILDQQKIALKLQRMAYQIWEKNSGEKEIVLIGIEGSGIVVAQALAKHLKEISPLKVVEQRINLDKKNPLITPAKLEGNFNNKTIILVDDVANSGRTLLYAMKPLLEHNIKKILLAVLVDRKHKSFPIVPDIVGHTIATTLQEHIEVECDNKKVNAVYLL